MPAKAGGLARASDVPFATAAVTVTVGPLSGASSYSIAFTWPPGRFTASPISVVTNNGGSGSSGFYAMLSAPPDTVGGTILVVQRDLAVASITSITLHVIGVQMTSTSGAG